MFKKWFAVDIMLTNNCNFKCKYCIELEFTNYHEEVENNRQQYNLDDAIAFLDKMLEYCLNNSNEYYGLEIHLWGGEPTLKLDKIEAIVEHFKNSNNVRFLISTNGYKIDKFINYINKPDIKLKRVVSDTPFFMTQISYDGMPIQDIKRITRNDLISSKEVNKTFDILKSESIPYSIKSTLTIDTLENLYDAYVDVAQRLGFELYFPTIDYRMNILNSYSEEEFNEYLVILKKQLFKIIKDYEAKQISQTGLSKFSWLNYDKRMCAIGWQMCAIDTYGDVYPCHGALGMPHKTDHYIGHINDNDIIDKIFEKSKKQINKRNEIPDTCSQCDAVYCLRCDISKYEASKKTDYYERLFDYSCQSRLCKIYKHVSNISMALHRNLNVPLSGY